MFQYLSSRSCACSRAPACVFVPAPLPISSSCGYQRSWLRTCWAWAPLIFLSSHFKGVVSRWSHNPRENSGLQHKPDREDSWTSNTIRCFSCPLFLPSGNSWNCPLGRLRAPEIQAESECANFPHCRECTECAFSSHLKSRPQSWCWGSLVEMRDWFFSPPSPNLCYISSRGSVYCSALCTSSLDYRVPYFLIIDYKWLRGRS